jgi:hypothetical protein
MLDTDIGDIYTKSVTHDVLNPYRLALYIDTIQYNDEIAMSETDLNLHVRLCFVHIMNGNHECFHDFTPLLVFSLAMESVDVSAFFCDETEPHNPIKYDR